MTRTVVKSIIAAGAAVGVVLSMSGVAYQASKPPQAPKTIRAVAVFNQAVLLKQGLTPQAAIKQANHLVPYHISTLHYTPKGFQLVYVRVFPFIANVQTPSDTLTFLNMSMARKPSHPGAKAPQVPSFEIDHQGGQPFTYQAVAFFTLSKVRLGKFTANVAEQKYTDAKTKKGVDLLYVYWWNSKSKLATEVTAELTTAHLTRSQVVKIAASIS